MSDSGFGLSVKCGCSVAFQPYFLFDICFLHAHMTIAHCINNIINRHSKMDFVSWM